MSHQPKCQASAVPVPGEAVFRRNPPKPAKLIVCVHGMGDQVRNDFAQAIARLFARNLIRDLKTSWQATELPIGVWDGGGQDSVTDHAIAFAALDDAPGLGDYAFAEAHWADLPRQQEESYRLEESKQWAGTVAKRFAHRNRESLKDEFGFEGPRMAVTVLEQLIESVAIFEKLLVLAEKAGIFRFDLGHLLTAYLGDVQQVTDFRYLRDDGIQKRFLARMDQLARLDPKEIHVIAHSEGTVVAFHGLLSAMRDAGHDWIDRVVSFTTLGSPIDKHLILWPEMWFGFSAKAGCVWKERKGSPIRWHNYFDYADPVGYELDTARDQLKDWNLLGTHIEFDGKTQDHGFRRYPLPGKAHVDYFGDDDLFAHVLNEGIRHQADIGREPRSCGGSGPSQADRLSENGPKGVRSRLRGIASPVLPFLLVFCLCLLAVFVLHKSLGEHPDSLAGKLGIKLGPKEAVTDSTWGILGCAVLLFGTAVLARTARLLRSAPAVCVAGSIFAGCAAIFWWFPGLVTLELTYRWTGLRSPAATVVFCLAAVGVALRWDRLWLSWRKRPVWGLRCLVMGSAIFAAALILPLLRDAETPGLPGSPAPSLLKMITGGVAFVYLWWLALLLYDLSFSWIWYINRENSLITRLRPKVRVPDEGRVQSSVNEGVE